MITAKQESVLIKKIKSLSELEFESLIEEVAQHVHANKWQHIITNNFSDPYSQDEISNLEQELEDMARDKDEYYDKCFDALRILEDIENIDDDVQKQIDKAIKILE